MRSGKVYIDQRGGAYTRKVRKNGSSNIDNTTNELERRAKMKEAINRTPTLGPRMKRIKDLCEKGFGPYEAAKVIFREYKSTLKKKEWNRIQEIISNEQKNKRGNEEYDR